MENVDSKRRERTIKQLDAESTYMYLVIAGGGAMAGHERLVVCATMTIRVTWRSKSGSNQSAINIEIMFTGAELTTVITEG